MISTLQQTLGGSIRPASRRDLTSSDGSATTTITYADGSQTAMTIPAPNGSGASPDPMGQSFMQSMIQHQAQLSASQSAGQSLPISA